MKSFVTLSRLGLICLLVACRAAAAAPPAESIRGPLRVHPTNPRYFTDDSGRAILLTGSHTWNNLVDMGPTDPPPLFQYEAYLDWLAAYPHNFFRLWAWELVSWNTEANREGHPVVHYVSPHPWVRSGPGQALDGKPKFNLQQFNPDYFNRLRQRVEQAQTRGLYVAIMLFEGWGIQFIQDAWTRHPFHPQNNVNQLNSPISGVAIHELADPQITALQEAYVRHLIDAVNPFDNVLYEISNENHPRSTAWQYHMIRFIKDYEKTKPKQHPVGMTFQYRGGQNEVLFNSPADWISPNAEGGYRDNPPDSDGRKIVITDTDHLWGIGGSAAWVWKSFFRGLNPIFMDCHDGAVLNKNFDLKWAEPVRQSMGHALNWSRRVNLVAMTPHNGLASSEYCLARPRHAYLVYLPGTKEVTLDLRNAQGDFEVEWFNPTTGQSQPGDPVTGGQRLSFASPFPSEDTLLYLKRDLP